MISEKDKNIILDTLSPYKPTKVGVFGSRVRSEQKKGSDLDLLVNLGHINLFELVELERKLSSLLQIKVDLVTEKSLNKHLKPVIEKEIRYLLNDENR